MCHLTEKLCSGYITNDWSSDEGSLFHDAVHARMTFFSQLMRGKLNPLDYGGRNGMAQTQFRQYAGDMVAVVIDAHEQTLEFPEEFAGQEGLVHGFIKNPTHKIARYQMLEDVYQLCSWANAESAKAALEDFIEKPENNCTREEIWAATSHHQIRF